MSIVIKGGTVVAADRSYHADVLGRRRDDRRRSATNLTGDKHARRGESASSCPGGIDPHTHLDMPFMGTNSADNYESGTKAGAVRRHDDGGRLLHPGPRPAADGRAAPTGTSAPGTAVADYSYHMCHHLLVRTRCARTWRKVVKRGRDDLQAFHGLQGLADGQRRGDVRLVLALRRARRDAAGPRRERRRRRRAAEATISPRASPARRATRCRVRRTSRARRPTARSCSPIRRACRSISCTPPAFQAHEAIARARALTASASTASR